MLKVLQNIIQEVNAAHDLQEALRIVVSRVCEVIQVESCSIFLIDPSREFYILMASQGFNPGVDGRLKIKINEGLVGLVGKREEPLNIEDAPEHSNYIYFPMTGEERYRAFLGVPIIHQRHVLGVLVVQQEAPRKFEESEEAFLVTISAQLSGWIAQTQAAGAVTQGRLRGGEKRLFGMPGAPGVAVGTAVIVYPLADLDAVPERMIDTIESEIALFDSALQATRNEIYRLSQRLEKSLLPSEYALFDAYLRILDNEGLGQEVMDLIQEGYWAQSALKQVIKSHVRAFEEMDEAYLQERAADLKELGRRVLLHLQSEQCHVPYYPRNTILVGEEITAPQLAEVPEGYVIGIVSAKGSSNSHIAILARALGIPTVIGVQGLQISALEGQKMIVDGDRGRVYIAPSPVLLKEYKRVIEEARALSRDLAELADKPAQTPDGHPIPLYVNMGLASDISSSMTIGAEGVGLYRTEVPFMIRERFPTEEEQRIIYREILELFTPRPVVMRTLDIGGDKTLPYFPIEEPNPFLGWRGIRVTLDHPEIFLVQIRAMIRASAGLNNLRIMLPMVSQISEVIEAKNFILQAYQEVLEEESNVVMPKIGVMIEVPSVIYQMREMMALVDFASVGSNDLTQYLLAIDRNNARVANLYDALHPSVLRALMQISIDAHAAGKPVSICGEMAGDPASAILLMAMDYATLSMNATSIPKIKWVVRNVKLSDARKLLEEAKTFSDAASIRAHLENALEQLGLGKLVRGK